MKRRVACLALALAFAAGVAPGAAPVPSAAPAVSQPTITLGAPDAVIAGLTKPATGSTYTISNLLYGKPIRWNPCAPIHWQFRAAGAPTGALTVVRAAISRISTLTGTHWFYDGTVTSVPGTAWLPKTSTGIRPVLIGWGDAATSDLLRGQPTGVLGVTRTAWFGLTRDGVTTASLKAAVIVLDRTDHLPMTGRLSWRTVLLHELGHAMGLDHAGSSRQLMYPMLSPTLTDLQSGDIAGLSKVGSAAGCTAS